MAGGSRSAAVIPGLDVRGRFQGLSSATCTVHARGGVCPERPSHCPPVPGVGGQPGLQGAGSASSRELGRREASQGKKETPKLRVIVGSAGGALQGTPTPPLSALIPQRPAAPPSHSSHRTLSSPGLHSPCSRAGTLARRPSDDPSPSPESAAPGCAPAPPTGRQGLPTRRDWPTLAAPGVHWLSRLPVPRLAPAPRVPAHSCGATWPRALPAQRLARLRTRGLAAPGGQAS